MTVSNVISEMNYMKKENENQHTNKNKTVLVGIRIFVSGAVSAREYNF